MHQSSLSNFYAMLAVAILLATVWMYAPALNYGFIWDDPVWLGRIAEKPIAALIGPITDYHFYRPVILLYHRLFMAADRTFNAPLLHAAQIGWHVLNVALVYALSRRLRLREWEALTVAGLVAWYPFSHQAVAWALAHQPVATALQNGAWLAYLVARQRTAHRRWAVSISIGLFTAALLAQESTVALAGVPLLMEWVLRAPKRRFTFLQVPNLREGWAWLYPALAFGFALVWLLLPRQPGMTRLNFQVKVPAFLLQGFTFPLLGAPGGYAPGQSFSPVLILALAGCGIAVLVAIAWRTGRARLAIFGLAFAVLGIAPAVVGLRYSYVSLSSRLLYYSGFGVAMLWVCALLPPADGSRLRRVWRIGGVIALGLITLQSGLLLNNFQQMYAVGAAHIHELNLAALNGASRVLFVNFPDRYAPRRSPYPLGYWGVTLAPISVDLGDFPVVVNGSRPQTLSRSLPQIDAESRAAGPYQIDMRGVQVAQPEQLYYLARQVEAVYVSRYFADGSYALERAGTIVSTGSDAACQLALFGQAICLQAIKVKSRPGQLTLVLTWQSMAAARPHDTMFAHVGPPGQPPLAQADGDAWLGLLPVEVWQPGDVIREERVIALPQDAPPHCAIRVGLYNRLSGERLPATTPAGAPLPGNAFTIQLTNDQ